MKLVSLDTETYPLGFCYVDGKRKSNNRAVPRLVCMSYQVEVDGVVSEPKIAGRRDSIRLLARWLQEEKTHLIGARISYEFLTIARAAREEFGEDLLPAVFAAYDADRVHDVLIRETLIEIATKPYLASYSLEDVEKKRLGLDRSQEKNGFWRVNYARLDGVHPSRWPDEARDYAIADAVTPLRIFHDQGQETKSALGPPVCVRGHVLNEPFQVRADFATTLISAWGLAVDQDEVARQSESWIVRRDEAAQVLQSVGLLRPDGTKNVREIQRQVATACTQAGIDRPLTKTGQKLQKKGNPVGVEYTSYGSDAIDHLDAHGVIGMGLDIWSGEATTPIGRRIQAWARYSQAQDFLTKYLEPLASVGGHAISPYLRTLIRSGRMSSSKPNSQNFPGRGFGALIRHCFRPRPGFVYVNVDYSSAEMRTFAQVCLNIGAPRVRLAEDFRAGRDPHLSMAAEIAGVDYGTAAAWYKDKTHDRHKFIKLRRTTSKPINFGVPGGMGPGTLAKSALNYGVRMTPQEADHYRKTWHRFAPEGDAYFAYIRAHQRGRRGKVPIQQHGPGGGRSAWRIRLCEDYTSACNTLFQGMAADMMKEALWRLVRECYAVPSSPLYGCRVVLTVHDEAMLEAPSNRATAAADRMTEIMIAAGSEWVTGMPVEAEPAVGLRWDKEMSSVRDSDGEWSVYVPDRFRAAA